jgi:Ca2+-transporting ATPase
MPQGRRRRFLASVLHALAEPMFVLLLAAAGIYMLLGDRVEALFLLASVVAIVALTLYQERRTDRVLEALRDLSSPRALVIRDGAEQRIPGREVVRGDLLVVHEGDRVAGDGTLVRAIDLRIDESLLTGESVAVDKRHGFAADEAHGESAGRVFAGTLVVKGHGLATVTATGAGSEMGRIGQSLGGLGTESSGLQAETRRLVRLFSIFALLVCLALTVAYGLTRGDWLGAALAGLTLAMAMLPEEFPVVLTVFLALGAWRMTRVNVLTRRVAAIEALGAASVLCVDKTGTLTRNVMTVRELRVGGRRIDVATLDRNHVPADVATAMRIGLMASEPRPFDPMERALHALSGAAPPDDTGLVRRYPLSSTLLAVTHVWRNDDGRLAVAIKGAPESIIAMCGLSDAETARVTGDAADMAASGLRVLGLAHAERDEGPLPDDPRAFAPTFAGLVGLADPLRPTVPAAMRECHAAGVRVVMITGDYPVTARAIAREAGLAADPQTVTGSELAGMDDAALAARLPHIDVFARVLPAQKLRIVRALQARGDVVAMTGDGVNDAPALKASDIGIAMGGRGTDVAREASALVLLDDDFGSIVRAIRQGRRIFDNLRKAMSYLVAVHIPIAGLGLLPVLLGAPPVLFPAHVVFLEFIIDPACSIAFEAEPAEPEAMRRPPRPRGARLIGWGALTLAVAEGALALAFTLALYQHGIASGRSEPESRALAFTAIVIANLSLIFFSRSAGRRMWRHIVTGNRSLWLIVAGTVGAYALAIGVPVVRTQFRLAPLGAVDAQWLAAGTVLLWLALAALHGAHGAYAAQRRRKAAQGAAA